MEKSELPTLDELLATPCEACGRKAWAIRQIDVRPNTVTLRCEACSHLRHNVRYRDA